MFLMSVSSNSLVLVQSIKFGIILGSFSPSLHRIWQEVTSLRLQSVNTLIPSRFPHGYLGYLEQHNDLLPGLSRRLLTLFPASAPDLKLSLPSSTVPVTVSLRLRHSSDQFLPQSLRAQAELLPEAWDAHEVCPSQGALSLRLIRHRALLQPHWLFAVSPIWALVLTVPCVVTNSHRRPQDPNFSGIHLYAIFQ